MTQSAHTQLYIPIKLVKHISIAKLMASSVSDDAQTLIILV